MAQPIADLACLVVDCADPEPMARFYSALGGSAIQNLDESGAHVQVGALLLVIRVVDDYVAPTWPTAQVPMQLHLDLSVDDLDRAERRLVTAGGTVPAAQHHRDQGLIVILDPAGHPLCIGTRI